MDRANYETYDTDAVYDDMDAQNQPAERVENVNNANWITVIRLFF